jgi:outer membrane lipoprotein SlyB
MKKVTMLLSVLCCGTLLLTGCARNISANSYDARALNGTGMISHPCKVISVRTVAVEEGDYLEDNKTGTALGAVAGGLAGNMIGGGRGRILATGVGAIAGAVGGAFAEKALKSQNAYEYVVQLTNGTMRTVVQGMDTFLQVGQEALLIEGTRNSRPRLIAR